MRRISAFIVDDEENAVTSLKGLLDELCPMVTVLGTANSIEQAVTTIEHLQPQIVFVDIEMPPNGSGFDLLQKTQHLNFGVIFTTAYEQYAVRAINEFQPWAYLVKPIKSASLIQAVQIAMEKTATRNDKPPAPQQQPRGLILPDKRKGNVVVRFADLICCLSEGSLTFFHYYNGNNLERLPVYRSLKEIETEVPRNLFCRVHHGALVNMTYVRRYERVNRSGKLYLDGNITVEVSHHKMEHFSQEFDFFIKGTEQAPRTSAGT
ncbi:MAG: LytR/AlgR family response regulator transcription factor [Saprospiraceae bacterium]